MSSKAKFGKPIQILKLNNSTRKLELNIKQLESIFLDKNLENVELSVLSIAGAFRKGKSFLLSFFLRFLNFYYKYEYGINTNMKWLNNTNAHLFGFPWRNGCDAHTTGIWMWSRIFTKTMPNGQRIGIVLMDTQGMFDNQTDTNTNVTIFALSTMLSSIQIYNLSNNIRETDLQHQQMFTEYGKIAMENGECETKPFQQLMFLIRDWNYPTQYPYGLIGGNKYFQEKVFNVRPDSPSEIKAVREHLKCCIDEATCFLMPHPGENVRTKADFDGRLCDIDPNFIKYLNQLVSYLLKPANISRTGLKKINGSKINPREFYNLIQQYWNVFKSGKIPPAKNILQASTEVQCVSTINQITKRTFNAMCNYTQLNDADVPQLIHNFNELMNQALKEYDVLVVMGDQQTRRHYRQELTKSLQDHVGYLLGVHSSKKTKSLEEMITKLSAEVNEFRMSNNNNDSALALAAQNQLFELMKSSHNQQLVHIKQMEKNILRLTEDNKKLQNQSFCSIM